MMSREPLPTPLQAIEAAGFTVAIIMDGSMRRLSLRAKVKGKHCPSSVLKVFREHPREIRAELERRATPSSPAPAPSDPDSRKLVRNNDPSTSRDSAEWIVSMGKLGELQREAHAALLAHPDLTQREMSDLMGLGSDSRHLARRYPELEVRGLAMRLPKRPCRVSGRPAEPWRAIDQDTFTGTQSEEPPPPAAQQELF